MVIFQKPLSSLECMYCGHSRFFSPPEQGVPVFLSGPCPFFSVWARQNPSHAWTCTRPLPAWCMLQQQQLVAVGSRRHSGQRPHFLFLGALPGCRTTRWGSACRVRTTGSPWEGVRAPSAPYLQCRIAQRGRPPGQHPRASFLQRDGCERRDVTGRRAPRCHVTTWGLGGEIR